MSSTTTKTGSITAHPTSYDTTNYSYASISTSYPITNAYTDSTSTSYCQVNWKTGSNAESYVYLKFNFSEIPSNATITSISASVKGYVSTTNNSRVTSRQMQLATGTTLKGSALTMSTSTSAQTFTSVGDWTRAEVEDIGIRFYVKRGTSNTTSNYNFRMYGATITVNYQWVETTYDITVNNSTSATVTANPDTVLAGQDTEIRASTVTGLTITDNGNDITSSFTQRTEAGSYSVTNVGTYGFALNNNDYYESNNKGVNMSAAVCRVDFYVPVAATITFQYINYAEASYDFGVFGNIDVALSNDYYAAGSNGATITDSSYARACNTSSYNSSSVQTLTYSMSSGEHSIWVKFSKDDASAANNDTLQFKVSISLNSTPGTYYGYDITNVQADHTIVVTSSGSSEKIWYKEESPTGWAAAKKVFKKNSSGLWIEQTTLTNLFDTTKKYNRVKITNTGVTYYNTATALSSARTNLAATAIGDYALFGGGNTSSNSNIVDAYNISLTRSTPTTLSSSRSYLAATTVGDYALFGGGSSDSSVVDAYDTSLTRTIPTALSNTRAGLAATTIGDYALFGGGYYSSSTRRNTVNAYDTSLTRTTPTSLNTARSNLAATTVGDYALFGGGIASSVSGIVDSYNQSLTHSTQTSLSTNRYRLAAATTDNYALFGGGSSSSSTATPSNVVDAYNTSLTHSTPTALSVARQFVSAASLGGFALFGGGGSGTQGTTYSTVVDVYNTALTQTNPTGLSVGRNSLAATIIRDYILFGGGTISTGSVKYTAVVDVYQLIYQEE